MTLEESLEFIVAELRGRLSRENVVEVARSTCLSTKGLIQFVETGYAPYKVLREIAKYFDGKTKRIKRMIGP
jgi:hypothetical protein